MRRLDRVAHRAARPVKRGIDVRGIFQDALRAAAFRRWGVITTALLAGCAGGSMQTASQTPVVTSGQAIMSVAPPTVTRWFHPGAPLPTQIGPPVPLVN